MLLACLATLAGACALAPAAGGHAASHQGPTGPTGTDGTPRVKGGLCTAAASISMPEGEGHDHGNPDQHRFACRMRQVFFSSLAQELGARPDVVLGEMDVKGDLAAIAVTFPESGFLLFDVSDSSKPKFLSWYRGSECEQVVSDVNCGAFVDLASKGDAVFLSVQSLTIVPGARPSAGVRPVSTPAVEVIDIRDRAKPRLAQTYNVVSEGGVHTSRSHVIPENRADDGPRDPGEYVFSIANGVGIEITRVTRDADGVRLEAWNTLLLGESHDTFIQNDPVTKRTYLYVAGGFSTGFYVFDVTDPLDIRNVATWDLSPGCFSDWYAHTIDVTHRGNKRYVTLPAEMFNAGETSDDERRAGCGKVVGNGDRAGPLWIVDASDFSKLGRLGESLDDAGDSPEQIAEKSQQTLVATWTNPAARAGGNLIFSPHNQQIVGDKIYLSHYHGGVYVLDAAAAFAGKREAPTELGFMVPSAAGRPVFSPTLHPVDPFFTAHLGWRPSIWDMQYVDGYVIAADMVGGVYSLRYDGDDPRSIPNRGPRIGLSLRYRRGKAGGRRCARGPVTATLVGKDRRLVRRADFKVGSRALGSGGRRIARDRRAPFSARIPARRLRAGRVNAIGVTALLSDRSSFGQTRRVRVCAS